MARDANFEIEGQVVDKIPGGKFKVKLENTHELSCIVSGKIKIHNIRIVVGDKVRVAISPYDMSNGIITRRL